MKGDISGCMRGADPITVAKLLFPLHVYVFDCAS